jgi:hypothetical protein
VSSFKAKFVFALSALLLVTPAFARRSHTRRSSSSHAKTSHLTLPTKSHGVRGQQSIDSARVTEIQEALVREHYLTSAPNGEWNAETAAAMQKYQLDQGWQTKLMPDSRALKKLGLGPDYSNAINAKTATFVDPPPVATIPADQAAHFSQSSGVNR